jgi:CubicO group peptidase (beta-lactamase class C family)
VTSAQEAIRAVLERSRALGGQAVLLECDRPVWRHNWGWRVAGGRDRITATTMFQAASIAKTVAAWCIMSLVEEGRLCLDSPIGRYVIEWQPESGRFDPAALTLRRLMRHTAGLSLSDYPGHDPALPAPEKHEALFGSGEERLAIVEQPGTMFRYSGGGWALLQCAVEAASGLPFARAMEERVLGPLGMRHSHFAWSEEVARKIAEGHDAAGRRLPNYRYAAAAAAGLYTTARDLEKFLVAHRAEAQGRRTVLSPASLAELTSPGIETKGVDGLWPQYGLGYEIEESVPDSPVIGHSGVNRGWRSRFGLRLRDGAGLAVLINGDDDTTVPAAFAEWQQRLQTSKS